MIQTPGAAGVPPVTYELINTEKHLYYHEISKIDTQYHNAQQLFLKYPFPSALIADCTNQHHSQLNRPIFPV